MSAVNPSQPAGALNLALLQTATHWHHAAANRDLFDELFAKLPAHIDLVLLPEMFASGFTMHPAEVAESMGGPTTAWMLDSARRQQAVICGSLVIEVDDGYVNRLLWATPDGNLQYYDKRHLFRMAGEHEHYQAGSARPVFELKGVRVCPMVCYDLRFPVWFRNRNDYDLLVCVANWPAARQAAWDTLLRARAIENSAFVAGLNILGEDGAGVRYAGGSALIDYSGATLVDAKAERGVFAGCIKLDSLNAYRESFAVWRDADAFALQDVE